MTLFGCAYRKIYNNFKINLLCNYLNNNKLFFNLSEQLFLAINKYNNL